MPAGEGWDVPEEARGDLEYRWWRISGNRVLVLVVLSDRPVWYRGHFTKGRMVPCFGEGCRLCADGVGAQLRYVVAAAEVSGRRPGLLEVSHTVAVELKELADRNEGLRGLVIEVTKHSYSRHSRMEITATAPQDGLWWRELSVPDIRKALFLSWQKAGYQDPSFSELLEAEEAPRRPRYVPPLPR